MNEINALLDPADDRIAVGVFEHQDHSSHRFAFPVFGHGSIPGRTAKLYFGDVVDGNRYVVLNGYDDVADVVEVTNQSLTSNEIRIMVFYNVSAARIRVIGFQCGKYFADGEANRFQFRGVYAHLVLFDVATEGIHFHHAFHHGHLPADDPILNGAQVHGSVFTAMCRIHFDGVLVYFTQAG